MTADEEMSRLLRRIRKNRDATVVHHETCPCCGAKLVNLYRRDNKWKCRLCWEKDDADFLAAIKLGPGKLYMVDQEGNHFPLGAVKRRKPHENQN